MMFSFGIDTEDPHQHLHLLRRRDLHLLRRKGYNRFPAEIYVTETETQKKFPPINWSHHRTVHWAQRKEYEYAKSDIKKRWAVEENFLSRR